MVAGGPQVGPPVFLRLALSPMDGYRWGCSGGHLFGTFPMLRSFLAGLLAFAVPLIPAAFADDATQPATNADVVFPEDAHKKRTRIGYGRLITNDFFGDGEDRWRTGGVQTSRVWGPQWDGALPRQIGALIELRLGAEVLAPANLVTPGAGDRPYAGALSAGLHTHYGWNALEVSMGADLVFVGPDTGLLDLQSGLHDLLGVREPSAATEAGQIQNTIRPTVVVELGKTHKLSDSVALRPFIEGRAGDETLLRAGFDLAFGQVGRGELMTRDKVTGHLYRTIRSDWTGYSFVLGADVAHVADSIYLPESGGFALNDSRERVRAGVHWQGESGRAGFYGLTWLGKEFEGQEESQVIGSIRFNLEF